MNEAERKVLEEAGWKFTSVQGFMGLSEAEMKVVEVRAKIASAIKEGQATPRSMPVSDATKPVEKTKRPRSNQS